MSTAEIVTRAAQVTGWMMLEELAWLAETAAKHERILEVGSYLGRSTTALVLGTTGYVTLVDDLRGERGTPEMHGFDLVERLKGNLSATGCENWKLYDESCAAFYERWCMEGMACYDFVFIDGSHDFYSVLSDLRLCREMLAPGGLLAGHDWGTGAVKEALAVALPEARPVAGSIWQVRL